MKKLTLMGALVALSACTSEEATQEAPENVVQQAALNATTRVIVNFKPGADRAKVIAAAGGREMLSITGMNASAVELPATALTALSKNPAVEFVEEDALRYPMAQSTPYGINQVQAPLVWPSATGANRKICNGDPARVRGGGPGVELQPGVDQHPRPQRAGEERVGPGRRGP